MNKIKHIVLILILAALAGNMRISHSQINQAITYFPLKVGNVWIYRCTAVGIPPGCACITKKYRYQITETIVRNNKTYFLFQMTQNSVQCAICYAPYLFDTLRIDSATGNVYKYSFASGCSYSPFEIMLDSLNARLNDTVRIDCGTSPGRYRCADTSNQTIFGISRKTKSFTYSQLGFGSQKTFAQGIGITSAWLNLQNCNQNLNLLIGCVLDGVLYGDTSMLVGINQINSEVPDKFSLSQNYPNPFNPATNIKFQIPQSGFVKLTVFDVLGKEVQTLVNEHLKPGTYEVDFNGENLPSGVYYYKLEVIDASAPRQQAGRLLGVTYSETKKMVLIK